MIFAGFPCWYCGAPATTIDHIIAKSRGGHNKNSNLRPSCRPCNSSKGKRTVAQHRRALSVQKTLERIGCKLNIPLSHADWMMTHYGEKMEKVVFYGEENVLKLKYRPSDITVDQNKRIFDLYGLNDETFDWLK